MTLVYTRCDLSQLASELEDLGVDVVCVGVRRGIDLKWPAGLVRLIRQGRFDIVHAHAPLPGGVARIAARTMPRSERPVLISTEHNVWRRYRFLTRALSWMTLRLNDVTIAVSDAVDASLPRRSGRVRTTMRHGIDLEAMAANHARRADARAELGVEPGEVIIGAVSNLVPEKSLDVLLRTARIVCDADERARFIHIGQGPLAERLHSLRDDLGLGERFAFLGARTDARFLMAGFDLLAFSSRHEGLPMVAMEASALGIPIVATNVGGMGEIVHQEVNGVLVEAGRPDLLSDRLLALVRDERRRRDMSENALRIAARFDASRATREMERVYDTSHR